MGVDDARLGVVIRRLEHVGRSVWQVWFPATRKPTVGRGAETATAKVRIVRIAIFPSNDSASDRCCDLIDGRVTGEVGVDVRTIGLIVGRVHIRT